MKSGWLAVWILSGANLFAMVDRFIISLLLEPIGADLALSDIELGLITGPAFAVMFGLFGLPLGQMADSINRRNLIAWAIAFWGACTALCGLANGFKSLFAARLAVGAGEAALLPSAYSMLADMFPKEKLGRVMGVFMIGGNIGSGAAYTLGGLLFGAFTAYGAVATPVGDLEPWQMTFICVGLPGLLLALIVRFAIKEPVRKAAIGAAPAKTSIAATFRFIWNQRRFFVPAYACYALVSTLAYGVFTWHATFLIRAYDSDPAEMGLIVGPVSLVVSIIMPVILGWSSDKLRARGSANGVMRLIATMFAGILVVGPFAMTDQNLLLAVGSGVGMTGFMIGVMALAPMAIQFAAPDNMRGQLTAVQLLCSNLIGLSIGPVAVSLLSTHVFDGLGPALTWFLVFIAVCGVVTALIAAPVAKTSASLEPST